MGNDESALLHLRSKLFGIGGIVDVHAEYLESPSHPAFVKLVEGVSILLAGC